jgi:hypothetical protein
MIFFTDDDGTRLKHNVQRPWDSFDNLAFLAPLIVIPVSTTAETAGSQQMTSSIESATFCGVHALFVGRLFLDALES